MPDLRLKGPLTHQAALYVSSALNKLLRAGRRWGKTRIAFLCAIVGHGPVGTWKLEVGRDEARRTITWEGPLHRGCAQGYDVYWIARDYKQAGILWREEIAPKFKPLGGGVKVHETDRRISFHGKGDFIIRSAENINSVRGSGEKLAGVIIDEAAFLDLETALKDVLLPALIDNHGWLLIMSTTNAGPDGYEDLEVGRRTPSYFNMLCERYEAGELGDDWEAWYGTAWDNPALSPSAIQKLVDEYGDESTRGDSVSYQQEVLAKLLVAGAGVAFPELRDDVHLTTELPEDPFVAQGFRWSAGGDWGYTKPGALYLIATGPEGSIVRWEYYFRKMTAYQVGYAWGKQTLRFPRHEWIAIDTPAVSDGGPTILEELQRGINAAIKRNAPVFINPPKGAGSRATKKGLLHEALKFQLDEEGDVTPWGRPKLLFHATDVPELKRTLWRLPRDPKKPDDVDTNCFRGDESFLTPDGPVSFRDAEGTSGWAWTRTGWRPYEWCRRKGGESPTVRVVFDNGDSVVCTPDHRFLSEGEWIEARALTGRPVVWSTPGRSGGAIARAISVLVRGASFIAGYGKTSAAQSPMGTRSITSTAMATTTGYRICAVSQRLSTDALSLATSTRPGVGRRPTYGMPRSSASGVATRFSCAGSTDHGRGTALGIVEADQRASLARALRRVRSVARRSCAAIRCALGRPAATNAAGNYVVAVKPTGRSERVYCIHVPSVHEFCLANGYVVHNSEDHPYDAITSWLMARTPHVERKPEVDRHPDDHEGFKERYKLAAADVSESRWSRLPPGYEEGGDW